MNPALKERLALDYQQMVNLRDQSDIIDFKPVKGTEPYVTEYLVTINLSTYVSPTRTRDKHEVRITLPPAYPERGSPPQALMLTSPPPFHPNWYKNSRFCTNSGDWNPWESLCVLVVRIIKVMLFYPEVTATYSSANGDASSWYRANLDKFPLGEIRLDPDKQKAFTMLNDQPEESKTFRMLDDPPEDNKTFRIL